MPPYSPPRRSATLKLAELVADSDTLFGAGWSIPSSTGPVPNTPESAATPSLSTRSTSKGLGRFFLRQQSNAEEQQVLIAELKLQLEAEKQRLLQLSRENEGIHLLAAELESLLQAKGELVTENRRLDRENKLLWVERVLLCEQLGVPADETNLCGALAAAIAQAQQAQEAERQLQQLQAECERLRYSPRLRYSLAQLQTSLKSPTLSRCSQPNSSCPSPGKTSPHRPSLTQHFDDFTDNATSQEHFADASRYHESLTGGLHTVFLAQPLHNPSMDVSPYKQQDGRSDLQCLRVPIGHAHKQPQVQTEGESHAMPAEPGMTMSLSWRSSTIAEDLEDLFGSTPSSTGSEQPHPFSNLQQPAIHAAQPSASTDSCCHMPQGGVHTLNPPQAAEQSPEHGFIGGCFDGNTPSHVACVLSQQLETPKAGGTGTTNESTVSGCTSQGKHTSPSYTEQSHHTSPSCQALTDTPQQAAGRTSAAPEPAGYEECTAPLTAEALQELSVAVHTQLLTG